MSHSPGIKGSLKDEVEDFIVEEIPVEIEPSEAGKYTILKVKLTNWDTNRFLVYLARYLGISHKRITYCGTKDKRGITTQYFCLNHSFDPESIQIKDVSVVDHFRSDRMLRLGDLLGNRFTINLRAPEDSRKEILATYDEIMSQGGFPNFFGVQRFGSIRTNTHKIGRLLVHGEYEKAAMTYLYDPQFDKEDYRVNFAEHNDPVIALKEFPERLSFERSLLGYLNEHGNLKDALSALPRNLSMMFVHAYQSYMFNRMLSERLATIESFNEPQVGDVILKVDRFFNADKSNEISVNRLNQKKIMEMVRNDSVRVSLPLIGFETELSKGFQGEMEQKILEEEKLTPGMFRIQGHADLSSSGERRILSCKPLNFEVHPPSTLEFSLGRGTYATSLVREFLKK